jgi:pyruvate/2-oxoglutarate dehydrogenase complex dihydrolipoamide acyltransferase (E2) component
MPTNVIMSALELAQESGEVLRLAEGTADRVAKGGPTVEIETDKVTVGIAATAAIDCCAAPRFTFLGT